MYQRDFLLKQIEMMGKFISKIISRLQQIPEDESLPPLFEKIKAEFKNELGIDPEELLLMNETDFFLLLNEKQFNDELMDKLSEFFFVLGESDLLSLPLKIFAWQKALAICEKQETESGIFSLQRNERIRELHRLLQSV